MIYHNLIVSLWLYGIVFRFSCLRVYQYSLEKSLDKLRVNIAVSWKITPSAEFFSTETSILTLTFFIFCGNALQFNICQFESKLATKTSVRVIIKKTKQGINVLWNIYSNDNPSIEITNRLYLIVSKISVFWTLIQFYIPHCELNPIKINLICS